MSADLYGSRRARLRARKRTHQSCAKSASIPRATTATAAGPTTSSQGRSTHPPSVHAAAAMTSTQPASKRFNRGLQLQTYRGAP